MINEEADVFEEMMEEIGMFMEENFIPLIIMLVLFFIGIIALIRYVTKRRTENLRRLMQRWGKIKTMAPRITKNITMRICPMFGNEFQVAGEIYLVDSYMEKVLTEYIPEKQVDPTESQEEIIEEFKSIQKNHRADTDGKILTGKNVDPVKQLLSHRRVELERMLGDEGKIIEDMIKEGYKDNKLSIAQYIVKLRLDSTEKLEPSPTEPSVDKTLEPDKEKEEKANEDMIKKTRHELVPTKKAPAQIIIEEKTDTYVYLDVKRNTVAGLRTSGLKKNQNLLSMAGFMEVGRYDPTRSKIPLYMILVIEAVLNSVLLISIMTEREPSFLFEPEMWGWYALTMAFLGFYFYLDRALFGHYSIMYAYDKTEEEVEFSTLTGRTFSILIDIFWIETYYYPGFRVANTMKVNEDRLRNKIDDQRARLITRLASAVQTARSSIQFKDSLINQKSIELDNMQEQIVKEKAIAYYHGREDSGAQPMMASPTVQGSGSGIEILRLFMPLMIIAVVVGMVIIGIKMLADVIQLDSLQTTLLIIFALVLGIFLLFVGIRSVFESSKRSPM